MLTKSAQKPQDRLLNLFDILDDWLKAPGIEKISAGRTAEHALLKNFCIEQAKSLGAENPDILAEHIVLIARNAAEQNMRHPHSASLLHAKKAVNALILAQTQPVASTPASTQPKHTIHQYAKYSIAASIVMVSSAAIAWSVLMADHRIPSMNSSHNMRVAAISSKEPRSRNLTALDAANMYTKYEQMRQGTCYFPEALLIPDKHKAIYLENVVGGKLPNDLNDLAIANTYLEKVRCNYTPMLMAVSK